MTASASDLVVDSATGVEVTLPVAGPGARSFAFVIDWGIRVIFALAWYAVAARIYNGQWVLTPPFDPGPGWFALALLPPALVFFLYHPVLEIAMHGRTPGKRIAGVRIATHDGSTPSAGALLIRNIFRLIDSFPLIYGVGLITTMITRRHVRVGDLAAGTLLIYDQAHALPIRESISGALDVSSTEVLGELLERWSSLDPRARRRLGHALLERHARGANISPSSADDDAQLKARLEELAGRTAS